MGVLLSCKCETCLVNKDQEMQDSLSQKIIPISKNYSNKNILISSTTNINIINKSYDFEKRDLSSSFDDSIKRDPNNNITHLLNILISEQFYEKLIKGERLHNLLEFLYSYNNNILFSLLSFILIKIKCILNNSIYVEYAINELHHKFMKMYLYLVENNILVEIKNNIEEDYRIKYNLIDVVQSGVEIYHFFCYKIFNEKKPYNVFYWDKYKNYFDYIEQKINEIKNGIININLSIGDNKLKIIE